MSFSQLRVDGGGQFQVFDIATSANPGATVGTCIGGTDTQTYFRSQSTPIGNDWVPRSVGVGAQSWIKQCAAIRWSLRENNTIYACAGSAGQDTGGLLVSQNGGNSWSVRSTVPHFSGNLDRGQDPLINAGGGWPRPTGRLIVTEAATGYLFVGTYAQGVMRSANNGNDNFPVTIQMAGVTPAKYTYFCHSLSAVPGTPTTLFASFFDAVTGTAANPYSAIWKCTNAHAATPNFTKLAGSPPTPNDILILANGNMYAACGYNGIYRCTDGVGTTWTSLNGSFVDTTGGSYWSSLDGYTSGSNDIIVAACSGPALAKNGAIFLTIPSTFPGSGSITYTSGAPSIQTATVPPGNYTWWHAGTAEIIGRGGIHNPFIRFDPNDGTFQTLYCCSNSTISRTVNGGGSWTMAGGGCDQFVGGSIVADPVNNGHVVILADDWTHLDDTAPGSETASTLVQGAPPGGSGNKGYAVAFDPTDSTVYHCGKAGGPRDSNDHGEVFYRAWNASPAVAASWTALNFGDPSLAAGGHVPFGAAAGRDAGSVKLIVAAAWAGGMWRNAPFAAATTVAAGSNGGNIQNIATWSSPSAGVLAVASTTGYPVSGALNVVTSTGTSQVYYTGISGSTFTGCTYQGSTASTGGTVSTGAAVTPGWMQTSTTICAASSVTGERASLSWLPGTAYVFVFDHQSGIYRSSDYGVTWSLIWAVTTSDTQSGDIALNPATPSEMWVSANGTLYQLTNVQTGTAVGNGITKTTITAVSPAAGIAVSPAAATLGTIYAAVQDTGNGTRLLQSTTHGVSWSDAVGDSSFAQANSTPAHISVGPDSKVYVSAPNVGAFGTPASAASSATFTLLQSAPTVTGANGLLPLAFTQTGGQGSQVGSMLEARILSNDCSMTVTPPSPGWVLVSDAKSGTTTGQSRSQIWLYTGNPGGLGAPPAMSQGAQIYRRAYRTRGRTVVTSKLTPGGTPTIGTPQNFTYSNTSASVTCRMKEWTTPAGTVQAVDQTGTAGALTAVTSLPASCSAANAFANGLGLYAAYTTFTSNPGETWGAPSGWVSDGVLTTTLHPFADYHLAADAASTTSATSTLTSSTGMTSWAAAICTVYAIVVTPVSITTPVLPNGVVATAYTATLAASGGATPYSWAVSSGALPNGLFLTASTGVITGTPTTVGSFTFSVQVTDATGQTATASYTITISSSVSIVTTTLPNGAVETAYTTTGLQATGGAPPYTWSVSSGVLPSGLSLSAVTGVLTGTPDTPGTYLFSIMVTDATGATATQAFTVTITAQLVSPPFDSLILQRQIELLGNKAVSQLPQCPGAQFMLAPGFDAGASQPTQDVVAAMLLNGERPYGRRFSNRTITLPIVIQAPTRQILVAARETLLQLINDDTWEMVWTRQNGLPVVFDCFRALPPTITYSTKNEKLAVPTAQISVQFQALPFGRSDTLNTLAFPAPIVGSATALNPVLIDDFTNVLPSSQPAWWSRSRVAAVDVFSAHWDWSASDHDSAPLYTSAVNPATGTSNLPPPGVPPSGSACNIAGLQGITFWLGLGTNNYTRWHKGNITFAFTLTDDLGNTIKFGTVVRCRASNSTGSPRWNQITAAIPQGVPGFDYLNITAYSIQFWRMVDRDGGLELDADAYINGLYAVPTVTGITPPVSRGIVYSLNAIVGTGPAPLSLQVQQPAVPTPQSQSFTTPGPFTWIPPAGVPTVGVQRWGAGGIGAAMSSTGFGGGGHGGEFSGNPALPCVPGVALNGYVGAGGTGPGGFVQRVAVGSLNSATRTGFQGAVQAATTGGQTLLVTIAFGIGTNSVQSVQDSAGNVYSLDFAANNSLTGGRSLEVWACRGALALGTRDIITVTLSNPSDHGGTFICDEFVPLGALDTASYSFSTSQISNLGPNVSITANDGLAFTAAAVFFTSGQESVAAPFTKTGPSNDGGTSQHGTELLTAYRNAPPTGSNTATFSWNAPHTCVGVMIGYPVITSGGANGQDTWFPVDDATAAHGGLGAIAGSSAGQTGQTGTSSDVTVWPGGPGASGITTGGGGGESAGPSGAGHAGSDPAGGTGVPNAGDGGAGGAAGGNHAGQPGVAPGGAGGGAVSTGGTAAAGNGAAGQVTLNWTGSLVPFKTCVIHRPGLDAPSMLSPLVSVGNGADVPNGATEYPVISPVASQNARFAGTYTVVLVNFSWDNPTAARTLTVTIKQYEYPGGPVSTVSTFPLAVTPSTYDILNRATPSGNGFVVLGEVTLPARDLADDQSTAFFTVTVTSTDTADRFLDVLLLDTQGQTILVDINAATGYVNYYLDAPDPNNDLGNLLGSSYDRSQAISVIDSAIWAGGPISVVPGVNPILVYAIEGQPNLIATYPPSWYTDRLI